MALVIDFLKRTTNLPFNPGEKEAYCNTNYILLGELILEKTDQHLNQFAKVEIFDKLGMDNTCFIDPEGDNNMLKGYRQTKKGVWEDCTTQNRTTGPCGVISNASDMAKWDNLFAHSTLPENVLEIMRGPESPTLEHEYYGGLNVDMSVHHDYALELHHGGIEGFQTFMCRARPIESNEKPLTVFIALNQDRSSHPEMKLDQIAFEILENALNKTLVMHEETKIQEKPVESPLLQDPLDSYAGTYHNPISGAECKLKVVDGTLVLFITEDRPFLVFKRTQENSTLFELIGGGITIEFQGNDFTFDDGRTLRNHVFTRI